MGVVRGLMVVMLASLVSGCAAGRTRSELARLQSQVGLLDERVTQLERTGVSGPSAGAFSEPALETGASGADAPSPKSHANARTGSSAKPSAKASLKPSTSEIQQALKNAGFYQGAVDGKMGAMTREAVKEFQRVHGLADDGVIGKQTWAKLSAYTDLSASGGEASAAEVLK